MRTFFFQKDTTLRHNDRHISVDEIFTMLIGEGDRDIGILDTLIQRHTEDPSWGFCFTCQLIPSLTATCAIAPVEFAEECDPFCRGIDEGLAPDKSGHSGT